MATNNEEPFLTCKLCQKEYTDPRYLPCLHTFCKSCIAKDIHDTIGSSSSKPYSCPFCMVKVKSSSRRPNVDADGFPVNEFVESFLDAHRARSSKDNLCQPCSRNNKSTPATKWCCSCNETLCDSCIEVHQSLRKTMKHKLIDIQTMKSRPLRDIVADPMCPKHEEEVLEHFCEDHSRLLCTACTATDHRRCQNVRNISDSVRVRQKDIASLQEQLNIHARGAEYVGGGNKEAAKNIDTKMNNILGEIQFVRKKIDNILERCERNIADEVEDIRERDKHAIEGHSKEAEALLGATTNSRDLLKNASNHGTDAHLLQWYGRVAEESRDYPERLRRAGGEIRSSTVRFVINEKLDDVIRSVNELGKLVIDHTPIASSRRSDQEYHVVPDGYRNGTDSYRGNAHRAKDNYEQRRDEIPKVREDKRSGDRNASNKSKDTTETTLSDTLLPVHSAVSPSDTMPCWITGMSLLSTGMLATTDKNNKKIKLFDEHFKLKSERILKESPFDIASMGNGQFAVSMPESHKLEMYTATSGINPTKTIKVSEKCFGISFAQSKFAVACPFAHPAAIKLVSQDGQELHSISPSDGYTKLFLQPMYVEWDRVGSNLYISDSKKNQVICITGSKFKRFVYSQTTLSTPRGLAITEDDSFYVCGWASDNVQYGDDRGNFLKEMLGRHDGVIGPQSVCLTRNERSLIVTLDTTSCNSNNIFIFKILT